MNILLLKIVGNLLIKVICTYLSKSACVHVSFLTLLFLHSLTRKYPLWFAVAWYLSLIVPPLLYSPVIVPVAYFPGAMNLLVFGRPPQMLQVEGVTLSKCDPPHCVPVSSLYRGVLNPALSALTLDAGKRSLPWPDTRNTYSFYSMYNYLNT